MRFIFNFILFGFLFFLISIFFPDMFHTLVGWATSAYEFIKAFIMDLMHKYHGSEAAKEAPKALLFFFLKKIM
jgi:hypothetical protein